MNPCLVWFLAQLLIVAFFNSSTLQPLPINQSTQSLVKVLNVVAAVTNLLFWDVPSNLLFQEDTKQLGLNDSYQESFSQVGVA